MTNQANWYSNVLKSWNVKHLGPKPAETDLVAAHAFGKPGKQSLALAMAMRDVGVTAAQVIIACGAPQNNHRRHVIEKGYFKREPTPATTEGHTVYKVALTARGTAKLKKVEEAAAVADTKTVDKPKATKTAKKQPKAKKQEPAAEPAQLLRPTEDGKLQEVTA